MKISNIDWKHRTILVVEDDGLNFKLIEFCLRKTGAKLLLAKNGIEALEIYENNKDVDVVLMDICLPRMNGIEVTKAIRKDNKDLPVIMQSAFVNDFRGNKEVMSLFDTHLSKPFKLNNLIDTIKEFMDRKSPQGQPTRPLYNSIE